MMYEAYSHQCATLSTSHMQTISSIWHLMWLTFRFYSYPSTLGRDTACRLPQLRRAAFRSALILNHNFVIGRQRYWINCTEWPVLHRLTNSLLNISTTTQVTFTAFHFHHCISVDHSNAMLLGFILHCTVHYMYHNSACGSY